MGQNTICQYEICREPTLHIMGVYYGIELNWEWTLTRNFLTQEIRWRRIISMQVCFEKIGCFLFCQLLFHFWEQKDLMTHSRDSI